MATRQRTALSTTTEHGRLAFMSNYLTDKNLYGLYAITNHHDLGVQQLVEDVESALIGGARIIQYRDKSGKSEQRHSEAKALAKLCTRYSIPLIINDDITLAHEIGAQGVHLGKDDNALCEARELLGANAIIGISCYNDLNQAITAEQNGANYVAFGRFFPSANKPNAVQAYPELLEEAKQRLRIPIVAIGGITPENGPPLINAGADMLAVIEGVFSQPNIKDASKRFLPLFNFSESQ